MGVSPDLKLSPWLRVLLTLLDCKNNPKPWNFLQTFIAADPDLQKKVLEQEPNGIAPPSGKTGKDDVILVPTVPKEAQLSARALKLALSTGGCLDDIIAYMKKRASMSSDLFVEAAALWVGALLIAGRLTLKLDFESVNPNLYVLI